MCFFNKHVIIFLFDSGRMGSTQTETMEDYLKSIVPKNKKNVQIYYLKANLSFDGASTDTMLQVIFGDGTANVLKEIKNGLNLRNSESLVSCFKEIRSMAAFGSRSYFISCGHGSGYLIDPESFRTEFRLRLSENGSNVTHKPGIRIIPDGNPPEDDPKKDMIWNTELARAFAAYPIDVGFFNNCNVNFIDSLYMYSGYLDYIIASERYMCAVMLRLDILIGSLINNDDLPYTERLNLVFDLSFEVIREGATGGCSKPSLYLLKLDKVKMLFNILNDICQELSDIPGKDYCWFKSLRNALDNIHIDNGIWLVEFFTFLHGVHNLNIAGMERRIRAAKQLISNKIIIKGRSIDSHRAIKTEFSGISIYMPRNDRSSFHNNKFKEYFAVLEQRNKEFVGICKWYTLLNKIKDQIQPDNIPV